MRKTLLLNIIAFALFSCQTSKVVPYTDAEKELSNQLGQATLWFQKSAEMEVEFLQAYGLGKMLLRQKMDTFNSIGKKPAVILDLDETVMDNSPYQARLFLNGETYNSVSWNAWCNEGIADALPGALDFLKFAEALDVEIFYISNRKSEVLESTIENLKKIGVPNADTDHVLLRTAGRDKTDRRNIVKAQYEVLLYVGDNLTDYSEDYAERSGNNLGKGLVNKHRKELLYNFIMLPNPMYGDWESAIYNYDFSLSDEEKIRLRREILDTKKN